MSDLELATHAAHEAGKLLRKHFGGDKVVDEASDHDIKLALDKESQDLITTILLGAREGDALYGEEGIAGNQASSRQWIVDPIDGTRDFVRGRRGWSVSVALVEGGRTVVGVLDAPARDEHWAAAVGEGATLNGVPIQASTRAALSGARVPADILPKGDLDLVMVEKPNSIALRMAMVANGEADLLAAMRWGHEWDIAAAALIAEEAGATVTDALGRKLRFNSTKGEMFGVLACAPGIHAAAVKRLASRAATAVVR